jgi:hypothetical protein
MGFGSLQHLKNRRSTSRGLAHPLRSAFRVWLPSWRLTPFDPVPVLFRTGSAPGIHPSEHFPLGRYPGCYHPDAPTYRSTRRCSRRRSVGPAQQAPVSGFRPFRESLATGKGLAHQPLDAPMGLRPSRVLDRRPDPGFRPDSSHALHERSKASPTGAPEYQSVCGPPFPRGTPKYTRRKRRPF